MLKELYSQGHDFDTFMNGDGGEHVDKVLDFLKLSSEAITDSVKDKIMAVKPVHMIVFGEVWCPDCMINMAALEAMCKLNSNIQYTIVKRDSNEEVLKSITPDHSAKIPTFVSLSENYEVKGLFLEKPRVVKEVEAGDNQVDRIVVKRDYRNGKYLLNAIEELLELL